MSPNTVGTSLAKPSTSNSDGSVSGGSEKPVTTAPICCSQRHTQPPVKPVCPVTRILLPTNAFSKGSNSWTLLKCSPQKRADHGKLEYEHFGDIILRIGWRH